MSVSEWAPVAIVVACCGATVVVAWLAVHELRQAHRKPWQVDPRGEEPCDPCDGLDAWLESPEVKHCPHGLDPAECDACYQAADIAFEEQREGRYFGNARGRD